MKIKKAIEYFYKTMEYGEIQNDTQQEVYETAIKALEKQIPKKPAIIDDRTSIKHGWRICPTCGDTAGGTKFNYCTVCGQRWDWE